HLAAQEICLNGSCRTSWPEGGTGSSLWTASGNNIYYNSGNVGIATTSPTYALDVWGNARLATSTANVYLDFFGQYYTASDSQSTNTATTSAATGASATWSNPTNITASDNSYASKTIDYYGSSGALNATNFGFAIPTGATINGIVLDVEGKISSGSFVWTSVRLLKNGSAVGDNKTSMSMFTDIDKTLSTGGDSDLWGTTWTAEDINNTNFGATITLKDEDDTTGTVYVDHITIKVYYSYSVGKSAFASSIGIDKDNELFKISTSTGLTGKSIFSYNVAGNVGIGVDNASSTLEVAGSGRFWGDLRVGGNLATTSSARVGIVYQTGYGLVMENNGGSGYIHTDAGAHLTSGGVWTDASSEALKENFEVWNNDEVLSSIKTLAMVEYNYISEDDSVRHFGAMAEDWYDTFGLGDNVSISAKDVAMVALKGIQGLIERVDKLDEKISPATTTKTDSLEVKVIDSGWENYTLAVADNQIINENVYVKGVQVKELALFSGTIIVVGEGRFVSRVTFDSEVNFNGPVYFNKDSAGFVRLKAMATSTEVLFENEYRWPPVITVTPKSDLRNSNYWVAEETTKGFRIVINPIYNEDLDFSWQAVAVKDFIGQVAGAQETAATILGCTDAVAINFSPVANQDDGSCLYEQTVIVEDGSQSTGGGTEESQAATTEPIADISTVESTTEPASTQVLGCTDSSANNYNSAATQDDGSCQYAEIILSPSEVIDS
ncbi:MAG TPA: hypothetical protein PKG73_02850, partial [bacterium]|nr:hypothetical protein [bacterium]